LAELCLAVYFTIHLYRGNIASIPWSSQLKEKMTMRISNGLIPRIITRLVLFIFISTVCRLLEAAVFNIPPGDTNALITAITQANVNGEEDVINLLGGNVYELDAIDNMDPDFGGTGLPVIAAGTKLTINGPSLDSSGNQTAVIERFPVAPPFRILLNKGNLTLDRVVIRYGNESEGGGILNYSEATLRINNCLVSGNIAPGVRNLEGLGGGIFNAGKLTITRSTIDANAATYSGGGIHNTGALVMSQTLVSRNQSEFGGGITSIHDSDTSKLEITNSTISGNEAFSRGGGLNVHSGSPKLNHVTITMNTVGEAQGGGIFQNGNLGLRIKSSIVGNNTGTTGSDDCRADKIVSEGYNLLSDPNGCNFVVTTGDIIGLSPGLEDLKDNNSGNGAPFTHSLLPNSPAIDVIPASKCSKLDQRNFVRPAKGDSDSRVSLCDIGAHEAKASPMCFGVTTPFAATIVGGPGDDVIPGSAGTDVIHGLGGNDTITGLGASDFICGGTGDDTINGGGAADTLLGQDGNDTVNGGDGNDRFWGPGELGNNQLRGDKGDDVIIGGRGDDDMDGGEGTNDRCNGAYEIDADTENN
jgi:Ca2+-binding RTX toxin-like protein